MNREIHVRFCEGLGVQLPWATHLRTFTARACAASPLVCDARAGFSLTQLDQSFPRDSPKVEGKGVRSPALNESQEPVSEPAPSAAMRSSAAAIIVLKRGSLRRGSRSGSTLA